MCVGLSTTFLGIGLGIVTSEAYSDPKSLTAKAQVLNGFGLWVCFGLTGIFALFALINYCTRRGTIKEIKESSGNSQQLE